MQLNIPANVKIACPDLFQINCEVNSEKVLYLYKSSITECSPNDPFNDWTLDTCVSNYVEYIYEDFLDSFSNNLEIAFVDSFQNTGNSLNDYWVTSGGVNIIEYSTSSAMLVSHPSYSTFGVGLNDSSLGYWNNSSWYILNNNSNVSGTIYRDNTIVISAGKIYNEQTYTGGNEVMYNINPYATNIGMDIKSVGIFDDDITRIILNDTGTSSIGIYINYGSNNISQVMFVDQNGNTNDIYVGSNNNLRLVFVTSNSNITIKVLDFSGNVLANSTYNHDVNVSFINMYLPGNGNINTRYVTVPTVWSNLDNSNSTLFLNGSIPSGNSINQNWGS